MKKIFPVIFIIFFTASTFAFAADDSGGGLVPQACQKGCPCSICDFYNLGRNIISFLLKGIAVPVAAAMFLYGGVIMLTSQASEEQMTKGRNAIRDAIIGLAIAFFSYAIINVILGTLAFGIGIGASPGNWFTPLECTGGGGKSCEAVPPEEGPPPGEREPPPPGGKTDKEARDQLKNAGITPNFDCPRTCFDGLSQTSIDGAIGLQKDCGCSLIVTGGTEPGHSGTGPGSHLGGDKLDFRHNGNVDRFILINGKPIGPRSDGALLYKIGNTVYANESDHWDVCFNNC